MADLLDLDRYPLHDLDSPLGLEFVEQCRRRLHEDGSLMLEGFVRPDVIKQVAAEVSDLESFHRLQIVEPYFFVDAPQGADEDHPARHRIAQDVHAVAADKIPPHCGLRRIYDSQLVMDFLARVLDIDRLYHFNDPMQCLNVMYMKDGGSRAWHYDGSDFVVTLMLQPSLAGGEFEWAPFIRGKNGEENYDQVKRLFHGEYPAAKTSRAGAGTLALFSGRRSMHRVRAVYGPQVRIQSVLSFDTLPPEHQTLPPASKNVALYGERAFAFMDKFRKGHVPSDNARAKL
eukprot:INCI18369.1.p1 GENE.INCI18369.1~~INCI18369.1.p1  ORF type:complete len:287 (-),score=44.03 INCI18369.1:109-969(-)